MKNPWHIRRTVSARSDGDRRWDAAYQCLLQGAMEHDAGTWLVPSHQQEVSHGIVPVCSCLDHSSTARPLGHNRRLHAHVAAHPDASAEERSIG